MLLEDGTRFEGRICGDARGRGPGEVVFNTAMTGYQEAVTDPSYAGQIITFTYTMIGNYGVSPAAMESTKAHARGVIMRDARNGDDAATRRGRLARLARGERRPGRSPGSTPAPWSATSATRARCAAGSSRRRRREAEAREADRGRADDGRRRLRQQGEPAGADRFDGDGPHVVAIDTGIKSSIVASCSSAAAA